MKYEYHYKCYDWLRNLWVTLFRDVLKKGPHESFVYRISEIGKTLEVQYKGDFGNQQNRNQRTIDRDDFRKVIREAFFELNLSEVNECKTRWDYFKFDIFGHERFDFSKLAEDWHNAPQRSLELQVQQAQALAKRLAKRANLVNRLKRAISSKLVIGLFIVSLLGILVKTYLPNWLEWLGPISMVGTVAAFAYALIQKK